MKTAAIVLIVVLLVILVAWLVLWFVERYKIYKGGSNGRCN